MSSPFVFIRGCLPLPRPIFPPRRLANFAMIFSIALAAGCKFKPSHTMEEQPSVNPTFKGNGFFENGSAARPLPPGTVPRQAGDAPGLPYADVRSALPAWTDPASAPAAIPFRITRDVLVRGQSQFDIYCSECHGRLGNGDGMIVHRGFTPPPSFHIERLRRASDAQFYNTITNGYGAMFSYNDRVKPEDRWMIIAYIRALQASSASDNSMAHLSDADRRELGGKRP